MHGAAPPHRYIYIRNLLVKMRRDVPFHGRFLLPRSGDNENTPSFEGVAGNFDTILFLQSEARSGLHAAVIPITSQPLSTMSIRLDVYPGKPAQAYFLPVGRRAVSRPFRARGAIRTLMRRPSRTEALNANARQVCASGEAASKLVASALICGEFAGLRWWSRSSSYKRGNTGLLPKWHHVTVCVAVDVRTVPQRSPVFPWSVPTRLQNAVRFHLEFGNGPNGWNKLPLQVTTQ